MQREEVNGRPHSTLSIRPELTIIKTHKQTYNENSDNSSDDGKRAYFPGRC